MNQVGIEDLQETAHAASDHFCPVNAALEILNRRWTLHILRALLSGHGRFNDLGRVTGINPRTLCTRLRELEADGIVARKVGEHALDVEYSLTPMGLELGNLLSDLSGWARTWIQAPCVE
ncbi:MAG: hypothetical protein HONBIEJF_02159 [Fimbriimonadaceae bacterium]|nr:hypothetical protein [Fimbriimonadaceae bacterium]